MQIEYDEAKQLGRCLAKKQCSETERVRLVEFLRLMSIFCTGAELHMVAAKFSSNATEYEKLGVKRASLQQPNTEK